MTSHVSNRLEIDSAAEATSASGSIASFATTSKRPTRLKSHHKHGPRGFAAKSRAETRAAIQEAFELDDNTAEPHIHIRPASERVRPLSTAENDAAILGDEREADERVREIAVKTATAANPRANKGWFRPLAMVLLAIVVAYYCACRIGHGRDADVIARYYEYYEPLPPPAQAPPMAAIGVHQFELGAAEVHRGAASEPLAIARRRSNR